MFQQQLETLADFVAWLTLLYDNKILLGSSFYLSDDFTGSVVDTGKWSTTTGSPTLTTDTSSQGILQCLGNSGSNTQLVGALGLQLSTQDFAWFARWKNGGVTPASGQIKIGLTSGSGSALLSSWSGQANLQLLHGPSGTLFDTGIAVSDTTNYHTIRVRRTSGTMYVVIDGGAEQTVGADTSTGAMEFYAGYASYAGTNAEIWVDRVKLWIDT